MSSLSSVAIAWIQLVSSANVMFNLEYLWGPDALKHTNSSSRFIINALQRDEMTWPLLFLQVRNRD